MHNSVIIKTFIVTNCILFCLSHIVIYLCDVGKWSVSIWQPPQVYFKPMGSTGWILLRDLVSASLVDIVKKWWLLLFCWKYSCEQIRTVLYFCFLSVVVFVVVLMFRLMYLPHAPLSSTHHVHLSHLPWAWLSPAHQTHCCACSCMFMYCRSLLFIYIVVMRSKVIGSCSGSYYTASPID